MEIKLIVKHGSWQFESCVIDPRSRALELVTWIEFLRCSHL